MRRFIVALVTFCALAGSIGYFAGPPALKTAGHQLSDAALRADIAALTASPNIACYESALTGVLFRTTRSPHAVTSTAVAAFAKDWITGEAALHEVTTVAHRPLTSTDLLRARASIEATATAQASAYGLNCPGTPAAFLDELPSALRQSMIRHAAAVAIVLNSLPHAGGLTEQDVVNYFASHQSDYDTLCIAIAVVSPSQEQSFVQTAATGANIGTLARAFSQDPSSHHGGTYGCWAPTSSQYLNIRTAVSGVKDNTFGAGTRISYQGMPAFLHIAVLSRTSNTFKAVRTLVSSDAEKAIGAAATTELNTLLYTSSVSVGTHVGRWALIDSKPTVAPLAQPALADVFSGTLAAQKTPSTPYH